VLSRSIRVPITQPHLTEPAPHPQVRQLQAQGVRMRKDILAEAEVAAKFYRCAAWVWFERRRCSSLR